MVKRSITVWTGGYLKNKSCLFIFSVFIIAFTLRIYGIGFGLYHADEPIIVNHALAYATGDLNPHFFKIPPLASYLLFFVYGIYFIAGKLLGFFQSVSDFE